MFALKIFFKNRMPKTFALCLYIYIYRGVCIYMPFKRLTGDNDTYLQQVMWSDLMQNKQEEQDQQTALQTSCIILKKLLVHTV